MKAKSFTIYFNNPIKEIRAIVPSFDKLYNKLSDEQKKNITNVYSDNVEIDINDFNDSDKSNN